MDMRVLTPDLLTDLLPIHRETARRYRRDGRLPPVAQLALDLKRGNLGLIHDSWRGWQLVDGILVSPSRVRWNTSQLNAWHYERQLLASYQRQAHDPQRTLSLTTGRIHDA